jgi:dCMP deaminase
MPQAKNQKKEARPEHHEYFMKIALAVSERAICLGRHVGAVLVKDGRIISTGYNGTPEHMPNCDEREKGCHRCSHPDEYPKGTGYDVCICVHAEQNALLSAARFGIPSEGAWIYTTVKPCFGCAKEALQAKVEAIYYMAEWEPKGDEVAAEYKRILLRFPKGVRKVDLEPAALMLAVDETGEPLADTGHRPAG